MLHAPDSWNEVMMSGIMLMCLILSFLCYVHEILDRHVVAYAKLFPSGNLPQEQVGRSRQKRNWETFYLSFPSLVSFVRLLLELHPLLTRSPWLVAEGDGCWSDGLQETIDLEKFMNPDIGGVGVSLSLLSLPCVTLAALCCGQWHTSESGVKELCIANLANLVYLSINLCIGVNELQFPEVVVACIFIDCISTTVSMAFSEKQTLAARWLIQISLVVQLSAFIIMAKALNGLSGTGLSHKRDDIQCAFQAFWIVPISSSQGVPPRFWLHFTWRVLSWTHNAYLGVLYTGPFNNAEHSSRGSLKEKMDKSGAENRSLDGAQHANSNAFGIPTAMARRYEFEQLPTTVFTKYIEHSLTMFSDCISMYGLSKYLGGQWNTVRTEWGQSAPVFICIYGFLHWCYVQAKNLREDEISRIWVAEIMTGDPRQMDYPFWARKYRDKQRTIAQYQRPQTFVKLWSRLLHTKQILTAWPKMSNLRPGDYPRLQPPSPSDEAFYHAWKTELRDFGPYSELQVITANENLKDALKARDPVLVFHAICSGAGWNPRTNLDSDQPILLELVKEKPFIFVRSVALLLARRTNHHIPVDKEAADGDSTLTLFATTGNLAIVNMLLDTGAEIDFACPKSPNTPLSVAASMGHKEVVQQFLSEGASIDFETGDGATALYRAIESDQVDVIQLLLAKKANPNKFCRVGNGREYGYPLTMACTKQNPLTIIEILLKEGADINNRDRGGCNAFHAAAKSGAYLAFNKLMLNAKHPDSSDLYHEDGGSSTLFELACKGGSLKIVKALLDQPANMKHRQVSESTRSIFDRSEPIADGPRFSRSLARAADAGHKSIVIYLMRRKEIKFPQQDPRIEGFDTLIPLSTVSAQSNPHVIKLGGDYAVIQAGGVAGVRPGNVYAVMPLSYENVNQEDRLCDIEVIAIRGSQSLCEIRNIRRSIPFEGAAAFLQIEAPYRWAIKYPDLEYMEERIQQSKFFRPWTEDDAEPCLVEIRQEGGNFCAYNYAGTMYASKLIESDPLAAALDVVADAELLARSQHLITLQRGFGPEELEHDLQIKIGIVSDTGHREPPVPTDGSAEITVGQKIYIDLVNHGKTTIYVSAFNTNATGQVGLVSNSWHSGIEIRRGRSHTLGIDRWNPLKLRGLSVSWAHLVPDTDPVSETLVFIITNDPVDLRHFVNRSPNAPQGRGATSKLALLMNHLAFGVGRTVGAETSAPTIGYDVRQIPYLLHPSAAG